MALEFGNENSLRVAGRRSNTRLLRLAGLGLLLFDQIEQRLGGLHDWPEGERGENREAGRLEAILALGFSFEKAAAHRAKTREGNAIRVMQRACPATQNWSGRLKIPVECRAVLVFTIERRPKLAIASRPVVFQDRFHVSLHAQISSSALNSAARAAVSYLLLARFLEEPRGRRDVV